MKRIGKRGIFVCKIKKSQFSQHCCYIKKAALFRNGLKVFFCNNLLAIGTSTVGTAVAVNTGTIRVAAFYVYCILCALAH
jgi:hypothetical protein